MHEYRRRQRGALWKQRQCRWLMQHAARRSTDLHGRSETRTASQQSAGSRRRASSRTRTLQLGPGDWRSIVSSCRSLETIGAFRQFLRLITVQNGYLVTISYSKLNTFRHLFGPPFTITKGNSSPHYFPILKVPRVQVEERRTSTRAALNARCAGWLRIASRRR